jgi:hypothetical protein
VRRSEAKPSRAAVEAPDVSDDDKELGTTELGLLTRLLPLAVLVAAIVLFASELMTTFEFTPQGGEVQLEQQAADRHGNALIVIAVFAIIALAVAIFTGSKPAATAVAVAGVVALLVFLLADLPDANTTGTIDTDQSFIDAEAVPREGFYTELLGALALSVTGIALATMSPEQLLALRPGRRKAASEKKESEPEPEPDEPKSPTKATETEEEPPKRRSPRRTRTARPRR